MKALITGGAGFIGTHLTRKLLDLGHQVIIIDDLSTGCTGNIVHLTNHPGLEFVRGSILNRSRTERLVSRVDTVFHLAAAVGVRLIVTDPLRGLRTNLRGTEIVLEAAAKYGARVLLASTSEVYGKNTSDALSEGDDRILGSPLKSRWSYAQAKAIDETLAYLYWQQKQLPTVIVRPFNVVGPHQTGRYGMVVPRFVGQALRGEPLTVYGDGTQTRCFCHVAEVVDALIALIQHPEAYGQVFNLGRPEEISIRGLAQRVIELCGSSANIRYVPVEDAYPDGFEDMERRMPDISRARDLIGFAPTTGLDEILRDVIEHAAPAPGLAAPLDAEVVTLPAGVG